MIRFHFPVAVFALGGLVAAAEIRSNAEDQRKRLEDFRVRALAARQAEGLDQDRKALVTKYPTPEIGFSQPVKAGGGSEVTVAAEGRFIPGSLVVVPCLGIEVLSAKATASRAEARIHVQKDALPGECEMHVVSPVSAVSRRVPALRIHGKFALDLELANGMKTRWQTGSSAEDPQFLGQSEWSLKGKPLGPRGIVLERLSDGVRATVQLSEEEVGAASQAYEASAGAMEAVQEKIAALSEKAMECMQLPTSRQQACSAKYLAQMEELGREASVAAQPAQSAEKNLGTVCSQLILTATGGKVTGTASRCGGSDGEVEVTGTYRSIN